jgi:hypothetical protein
MEQSKIDWFVANNAGKLKNYLVKEAGYVSQSLGYCPFL